MPEIAPWQKKDKQLLPRLQHVMLHTMGCPSVCEVTKGLVLLSFEIMKVSDSGLVRNLQELCSDFTRILKSRIRL